MKWPEFIENIPVSVEQGEQPLYTAPTSRGQDKFIYGTNDMAELL